MKKNGFVFVETIVSIIILTSALLLLYTSFNKVLQAEKSRVYYDDINYIYRTYYIKNQLQNLNFNNILNSLNEDEDKYFATIGLNSTALFLGHDNYNTYISNLLRDFDVSQIVIVKTNKIDDMKKCNKECALNSNCEDYVVCSNIYTNIEEDMINYLNNVNVDISCIYIIAIEYNTCNSNNTSCRKYYSWVSV